MFDSSINMLSRSPVAILFSGYIANQYLGWECSSYAAILNCEFQLSDENSFANEDVTYKLQIRMGPVYLFSELLPKVSELCCEYCLVV